MIPHREHSVSVLEIKYSPSHDILREIEPVYVPMRLIVFWDRLRRQSMNMGRLGTPKARAELARRFIGELPAVFKTTNHGKYVAISLTTGEAILIDDTLDGLGKKLQAGGPSIADECYITKLGYDGIARIQ